MTKTKEILLYYTQVLNNKNRLYESVNVKSGRYTSVAIVH